MLNDKLVESNNELDRILNSPVNIKIICIINDKVLLDTSTKTFPNMIIKKSMINTDSIVEDFNQKLNITINSINCIPFEKYKDFNERYYSISIDENDFYSMNNGFSFESIDSMSDEKEKSIIKM